MALSPTPNMGLILPSPSVDLGPLWAQELNAACLQIDQHDHTSGKGVAITPAGMNIDQDLSFQTHNLLSLGLTRYVSHGSTLSSGTDKLEVYFVGNELYCNDGAGTAVQITSGGSVVGSPGNIGGMGSTTAAVTYSDITKTFAFTQDSGKFAELAVGDLLIAEAGVSSAHVIHLKSPHALAGDYSLTLFSTLPGSGTELVTLSSAGVLAHASSLSAYTITDLTSTDVSTATLESSGTATLHDLTVSATSHFVGNAQFDGTVTIGSAGPALQGAGNAGVAGWLTSSTPISVGQGNAWLVAIDDRSLGIADNDNDTVYGLMVCGDSALVTVRCTLSMTYVGGNLTAATIIAGGGLTTGGVVSSIYDQLTFTNPFNDLPTICVTCEAGEALYLNRSNAGVQVGVNGAGTTTRVVDIIAIGSRGNA